MDSQPDLKDLSALRLDLIAANGENIPYLGYIEAEISTPFVDGSVTMPVSVVKSTDYNEDVPMIVGTNILREIYKLRIVEQIPDEWDVALDSITGSIGVVKTT